jgi:hypothetical protein
VWINFCSIAWAGLIIAKVDINEVKIVELESKVRMNFLFIIFLNKQT